MNNFFYIDNPKYLKRNFIQWFDIPLNIKNKRDFILSIERGLDFSVGGENWDSLNANLGEDETYEILERKGKRIMFLVHGGLPALSKEDLIIYLRVLSRNLGIRDRQFNSINVEENILDKILDKDDDIFGFIAIFMKEDREQIELLLKPEK